jgi:hypothetical protein
MQPQQHVTDLNFYLFDGILHPELFEIREARVFEQEEFRAGVWLVKGGHVVLVGSRAGGVTEVVSPKLETLPWHRLLHTFALGQRTEDTFRCLGKFMYHTAYSREQLPADVFANEHAGYLANAAPEHLLLQYEPTTPDTLSPFALVHVEAVERRFSVQVVHAFPDEHTLVKTQSLIEPRKG